MRRSRSQLLFLALAAAASLAAPAPRALASHIDAGQIVTIDWEGIVVSYAPAEGDPDHVVADTGMSGRIEIELIEGVDTTLPFTFYGYRHFEDYGQILGASFSLTFDDPFLDSEFDEWSGCDVDCILAVDSPDDIFFEGLHDPEDVGFYIGNPLGRPEDSNRWDQSGDGDCSVCGNFVRGYATSWSITFASVPEPGTAALVAIGLVLVGRARRR